MLPHDFHPILRRWWETHFRESGSGRILPPTEAQLEGWRSIRSGRHTLIAAPTGSGKTLAAFLTSIDQLLRESLEAGELPDEVRVVYVSPLKALSADIHKNLAEPRREMRRIAEEMGFPPVGVTAAVRSGDTPQAERAAMLRTPPHILVTTPESLYLLLTAERSRGMLKTARVVIVDEIHAVLESRAGRTSRCRWSASITCAGGACSAWGCPRRRSRSRRSRSSWSARTNRTAPSSIAATNATSTSRSRCPDRRLRR